MFFIWHYICIENSSRWRCGIRSSESSNLISTKNFNIFILVVFLSLASRSSQLEFSLNWRLTLDIIFSWLGVFFPVDNGDDNKFLNFALVEIYTQLIFLQLMFGENFPPFWMCLDREALNVIKAIMSKSRRILFHRWLLKTLSILSVKLGKKTQFLLYNLLSVSTNTTNIQIKRDRCRLLSCLYMIYNGERVGLHKGRVQKFLLNRLVE